jgi:hypothetical protein
MVAYTYLFDQPDDRAISNAADSFSCNPVKHLERVIVMKSMPA